MYIFSFGQVFRYAHLAIRSLNGFYALLQEEHEEMHRKESEVHDPLLPGLDSSKRRYSQ